MSTGTLKMAAGTPKIQPRCCVGECQEARRWFGQRDSAMLSNGLAETSAEVRSLQDSLTKATRSAQEAPLEVQVKGAQEFIERAQKRVAVHGAVLMFLKGKPGCIFANASGSHAQTTASRARFSSSGLGCGHSEASRQGGQLQGQGETCPGQPKCRGPSRDAFTQTRTILFSFG